MIQFDSAAASLKWGRYGATVFAVLSMGASFIGYNIDGDLQLAGVEIGKQAIELASAAFALIAGIQAWWSKVRESKRIAADTPA